MIKKLITCMILAAIIFPLMLQTGCAQNKSDLSLNSSAGDEAPLFKLKNVNGRNFDLKESIGSKVLLLVFGTTWCPYCVKEIPELKMIHNNKEGIKVIYVDIQESEKKVSGFVKKHNIPYTVLLDIDGMAASQYKVRGVPTNVIVDKKGIIRERGHSIPSNSLLDDLVNEGR